MSTQVRQPFNIFTDVDGDPLESGYIYIGVAGLDAKTNPISVYFDSTLTTPAALPLRTTGGYVTNGGSAAVVFAGVSDYSITVLNKNGSLVYSALYASQVNGAIIASGYVLAVDDLSALRNEDPTVNKQLFRVLGSDTAGIGAGDFYFDENDLTSLDNGWTVIVTSSGKRLKSVDSIKVETVTVGAFGDYSTINDAISALSRKQRTHTIDSGTPYRATINLLSGFVMAEQLIVDGVDLSFINITSTDAEVTIQRSALTKTITDLDYNSTPAFLAVRNGCLPFISALFTMDTSGSADSTKQHGVMVAWGGKVVVARDCGVKNVTGRGLYGVNGYAYARNSNFSGAGTYCCRPGNSSVFNVRGSNFSNAGDTALYTAASIVSASDTDCSGAAVDAIQAINGSYVNCPRADLTNAGRYAVWARGGVIEGDDVDITGFATRGIQADNGKFIGDSVVCDNPAGVVANAVLGGDITLTNFAPTNVAVSNIIGAFTGGIVRIPNISITGSASGNQQINISSGGIVIAPNTTYAASNTPNKVSNAGLVVNNTVSSSRGTATIANGTTSIVVNHGLGVTPTTSDVSIVPVNSEAASAAWRIGSATSTTFTISANAAVAADATFAWRADVID